MKVDPIIAVKDIATSAKWYHSVLGCNRKHEGDEFAVLVSENDEVLLCLHKWGEHEHPTMKDSSITAGNGLILYFKTDDINAIYKKVEEEGFNIKSKLEQNPNSTKMEFSLRDPDGYYITITEYHTYEG